LKFSWSLAVEVPFLQLCVALNFIITAFFLGSDETRLFHDGAVAAPRREADDPNANQAGTSTLTQEIHRTVSRLLEFLLISFTSIDVIFYVIFKVFT
jgi:hypothetical protein